MASRGSQPPPCSVAHFRTQKITTMLTKACHVFLSRAKRIQSPCHTAIESGSTFSFHLCLGVTVPMLQAEYPRNCDLLLGKDKRLISSTVHPNQLWGPTSILFSGYWGHFSLVKSGWCMKTTTNPILCQR